MTGIMVSELIRQYYEESDPLKRKAILEESIAKGEEPEACQARMELWNCRYANKLDKKSDARADGFMKLWMTMKFFSSGRMGNFNRKRNQKEVRKLLKELGFDKMTAYGEMGQQVLFQECYHAARVYVTSCSEDKRYASTLLGLMSISKEKVQEKIAKDTVLVAKVLPEELQMVEELRAFSEGSIQAYKDMFPGDDNFLEQIV